jgi:electron transport complex protein RnfC
LAVKIKERKEKQRKVPIKVFPDPKTAVILTLQHSGAKNTLMVSVGDQVSIGQKIGDSDKKVNAPIHSPISGEVIQISSANRLCYEDVCTIPADFGEAIFIESDGKKRKDKTLVPISESELESVSNDILIGRIREAGIIGLGGAGFPTHIKLSSPSAYPIKFLVVNACESEIYDTSDERLLIEKTSNILKGVKVMRKVLGSPEVIIAIKENKFEAVERVKEVFSGEPETRIEARSFSYAQGDASLLQKALFGWEVPAGKRSYTMGVVVHNVSTINAVANAIFEGEPLISRVTTLSGDIDEPKNLLVEIGTPIGSIFDHYKIDQSNIRKVVSGGAMMGNTITSTETPVTKRTSSIIVYSKSNYKLEKKKTACIRCSRCISACPMNLHPVLIYEALEKEDLENAKRLHCEDCFGCRICSYVCPSGIPLAHTILSGNL